jgi:nucleotide-binding universal stress UspA family protein
MADPMPEGSTEGESALGPVLLCYDGSEEAAHAIHEAARLLGPGSAIVAHVWNPPSAMLFTKVVEHPDPLADAAEEFDATAAEQAGEVVEEGARLAREAGFSPETTMLKRVRSAWPALVELADERVARAVVVGSRGRSRVRNALLGGVASGVVAHSTRPVLVVRLPEESG